MHRGGSGIHNCGPLTLNQCTLSGNSARLYRRRHLQLGQTTPTLKNTIVAGKSRRGDIYRAKRYLNLCWLEPCSVGLRLIRLFLAPVPSPSPMHPTSPRSAITAGRRRRCRPCPARPPLMRAAMTPPMTLPRISVACPGRGLAGGHRRGGIPGQPRRHQRRFRAGFPALCHRVCHEQRYHHV